jgi:hypothetical protein
MVAPARSIASHLILAQEGVNLRFGKRALQSAAGSINSGPLFRTLFTRVLTILGVRVGSYVPQSMSLFLLPSRAVRSIGRPSSSPVRHRQLTRGSVGGGPLVVSPSGGYVFQGVKARNRR